MAFPPMLQAGLTLIGMFAISLLIQWQLALISLIVVPFLYYSAGLYGKRIDAAPRARPGARVAVAVDRARVDGDAAGDRLRSAASRTSSSGSASRARRPVDERVKLTVRQTMFTLLVNTITAAGHGVRARLRLLPRARGPARDRQADRAHVVHRGRLPAARADLGLGRPAAQRARAASRIVPAARHRARGRRGPRRNRARAGARRSRRSRT